MPNYLAKLLAKKEIAERTTAFFFEKPKSQSTQKLSARSSPQRIEGSEFKFVPGHFIEITINKETYPFSIASSPKEKELMITTRMRPTKFKRAFGRLKVGTKVKVEGPFGQFVLHKNKKVSAVFLAGGIGITPFRSMIKSSPERKITLFHSNRKKKDAPFLEELKSLENKNQSTQRLSARPSSQQVESSGFKMVAIHTRENGKHINPKMIRDNVKEWRRAIYYAVGSTGFVQSMADMLSKMKIKSENIRTENFPGY